MNNNPFHSQQKIDQLVARLEAFPVLDASDLIFNIYCYQSAEPYSVGVSNLLRSMLNEVSSLEKEWRQLPAGSGDDNSREAFREALQWLKKYIPAEIKAHMDCFNEGMANSSTKVMEFFEPLVSRLERIDEEDRLYLLMHLCSFKDYRIDFIEDGLHDLSEYMDYLWDDSDQNKKLKMAIDEALNSYDDHSTIDSFSAIIYSRLK